MSENLTDKLPKSNGEILTAIKNLDDHVGKIDTRLASLEQKVDGLKHKVDGLEHTVDRLEHKVDGFEHKVIGLEKKVDERLHDTRPIWHKVVTDLGELQAGQKRLEEHMIELNSAVRTVNRDQIVINDVIRHMQMDFHTIDERLYKLTITHNQQNSQT
jgi:chromosome segregation ATPase